MISALCWVPRGATHLEQRPQDDAGRLGELSDAGVGLPVRLCSSAATKHTQDCCLPQSWTARTVARKLEAQTQRTQ